MMTTYMFIKSTYVVNRGREGGGGISAKPVWAPNHFTNDTF